MRIAQLSDLHLTADAGPLYGVVDTGTAFLAALGRAASLTPLPDLLLLSGDLANDGDASSYRRLRARLDGTGLPYALIPGNHDDRQRMREVFPEQGWEGDPLCCRHVDAAGGVLLLLDTTIPGKEWGETGDAQIAWLEEACPRDAPALLVQHHPPFAIGIAGMDAIRCRGEERLSEWLEKKAQVEGLLCGHVHRPVFTTFAGRPAVTAPSTAHQIALQEGPLVYTLEPGGFLLHDWQPGRRLLTHYLPSAPGPVHLYRD